MENGEQVKDSEGRALTLQDKMEQKWGLPKGYLHNMPPKKGDTKLKETDLSYYVRTIWALNDGSTVFDLSTMEGELGYYMLLDHKLVANSEEEYRKNKWPKATHYIALENESETLKYKKNQKRSEAFSKLHSDLMTLPIKRKFIKLLDLSSTRSELTEEQIHNLLFDYISNSTFQPGNNIDKFEELYRLLTTATGKEEFEARYLLNDAVRNRIVHEKQGTYTWPSAQGPIVMGEKLSEAIEFILNPKKEGLVEDLKNEIKAKITT